MREWMKRHTCADEAIRDCAAQWVNRDERRICICVGELRGHRIPPHRHRRREGKSLEKSSWADLSFSDADWPN